MVVARVPKLERALFLNVMDEFINLTPSGGSRESRFSWVLVVVTSETSI